MKNKKGFTLVEVISVVALIGLLIGIAVPGVMRASNNAKKKSLTTKINNIKKAAVLYGQDRRENFGAPCDVVGKPCNNITGECSCYTLDGSNITIIKVNDLIDPDGDGDSKDGYIETEIVTIGEENKEVIKNPTNQDKYLNECEIQLYKKYGKIYAIYINEKAEYSAYNSNCWVNE